MASAPNSSALEMDLWPKAKFETDIVTPVSILRKQAALLGQKTQQLVRADVSTSVQNDSVIHSFRLVVPALDNYKYELFTIAHTVDQLYPLEGNSGGAVYRTLPDQAAFLQWLKEILSSEATLKKIDSMLAQSKG